jgi:putative endonuclease
VTGRAAAEARGRRGETAAALWLALKGYRVLDRRVRTPVGEIDLVARKGALIAFVEVKARRTREEAAFAITPAAQARIARAAQIWLARHPWAAGLALRFDLIAITPRRLPEHRRDAWRHP